MSGGAHGTIAIVGKNTARSIGTFENTRYGRNSKGAVMQMSARSSGNNYSNLVYAENGKPVSVTKGES